MRPIDADALEEILKDFESRYKKAAFRLSAKTVATVRQIVYAMKTVDAMEVKHGRWIEHEWAEEENGRLVSNFECSVCHSWERKKSDYCPNCGARLDGDENG